MVFPGAWQQKREGLFCYLSIDIAKLSFTGSCNPLKRIFTSIGIKYILGMKTSLPHTGTMVASIRCGIISLTTILVLLHSLSGSGYLNKIIGEQTLWSTLWCGGLDEFNELENSFG